MAIFKGSKDEISLNVTAVVRGDYGREIKVPFVAKYKKLKVDAAKALLLQVQNGELTDDDIIRENLVAWSGMPSADGGEVEYSPEMVEQAMNESEYREALVNGWMRAQFGRDSAKAKN